MIGRRFDPKDFCVLNNSPEHRLSRFERLTLTGGEELERALEWIAHHLGNFSFPGDLGTIDLPAIKTAAEFYGRESLIKNPAEFFSYPRTAARVERTPIHDIDDGYVEDLEFDSGYRVQYAAVQAEYESYQKNKKVYARVWRHKIGKRPLMIAVHGWTMGDQRINSLVFLPGIFYRLGMDVALVELPFHGRRKPAGHPDGMLFPSTNVARTNESIGQVIYDLRQLKDHFVSEGATEVGVVGMSLGGYVAALWASLDELAFCVPIVPMVSMTDLAWEVISKNQVYSSLSKNGLTKKLLSQIYHLHCPLSFQPRVSRDRMLLIAGLGDEIVPSRQSKLLWEHWGKPEIQWYRGGHVAQFRKSKAFREIISFMKKIGVAQAEEPRAA